MTKTEIWLEKFDSVHGKVYSYSNFIFNGAKTKTTIICSKHGEFQQSPQLHGQGSGCPDCGKLKGRVKKTQEQFIVEAKIVHGDTYIYDKVEYKDALSAVNIECILHGDFSQVANQHLKGSGCPKCSYVARGEEKKLPIQELNLTIQNRAEELGYSFISPLDVQGITEPFVLKCDIHGEFTTDYRNLIYNESKCVKCVGIVSSQEIEISTYFENLGVNVETSNRTILGGKEIDIYFPDFKLGVELDGIIWHSTKYGKDTNYHLSKTLLARENGVELIHIFEDEYNNNKQLVMSFIKNKLGLTDEKIFARKCSVREITNRDSKEFLINNHFKGYVNASVSLGLFHLDELVSVMTFSGLRKTQGSKSEEGSFELLRLCSKKDTNVIGGASKLLKFFERNYEVKKLITYADLRYSNGDVYGNLGFKKISTSTPNYFYVRHGGKRLNRYKFRKSELIKEGFDPTLSEREIMTNRGYYRIYDCGTLKFEKILADSSLLN